MLAAPSALRGPLTAGFVSPIAALSFVPSRSLGTCSSVGSRDLGLLLDDRPVLTTLHTRPQLALQPQHE